MSVDSTRVVCPLFQTEESGSIPTSTLQVCDLVFERCPRKHAERLCAAWHSRMPKVEGLMCSFAFHARYGDVSYAVALWGNPIARELPNHWLELRRLACAPDAPKNTPSRFLGWMARYFSKSHSDRAKLISYQDTDVHTGTIYKASGWKIGYVGKPMKRDRSKLRVGTSSFYRNPQNGLDVDHSAKIRWEKDLVS